jgi:hypothetical protein
VQGATPLAKTYGNHYTSEVGFCSIIGRRKRAVDALASTVPFFGVADRTAKRWAVKGVKR